MLFRQQSALLIRQPPATPVQQPRQSLVSGTPRAAHQSFVPPVPSSVIAVRTPATLEEWMNTKAEIKQLLRNWDASFFDHNGRMPEKKDKAPIAFLYHEYTTADEWVGKLLKQGEILPLPAELAGVGAHSLKKEARALRDERHALRHVIMAFENEFKLRAKRPPMSEEDRVNIRDVWERYNRSKTVSLAIKLYLEKNKLSVK
jgi:hypothetical protein